MTMWDGVTEADTVYVLEQAVTEFGFMPQTEEGKEFAIHLERRGWVHELATAPVWIITPSGRLELARLSHPRSP